MLIAVGAGQAKIVYKPEFFTAVYEKSGDSGILAVLAHEVGHAIDDAAPAAWMKTNWTPELRADAWTGCALAKMNLSASQLRASLTTLSSGGLSERERAQPPVVWTKHSPTLASVRGILAPLPGCDPSVRRNTRGTQKTRTPG